VLTGDPKPVPLPVQVVRDGGKIDAQMARRLNHERRVSGPDRKCKRLPGHVLRGGVSRRGGPIGFHPSELHPPRPGNDQRQ